MILYLDASALVKRHVAEPGSTEVSEAISGAEAIGTALVSRAEVAAALAKAVRVYALRGYDAVHLAAASFWQDTMSEQVTLSTFDRRLWTAAEREGLALHPLDLPALLDVWQATQ
jgi:predicted nucleic acid-binding protein